MIAVEGVDRCGKSTVVAALLRLMPSFSYRHHTKPPMNPYDYFAGFLADSRPTVVVDRCHLSETPYGEVFRGGGGLSETQLMKLELMSLAQGMEVLYMTDDEEGIRSRWGEEEMYSPKIGELLEAYSRELARTKLSWKPYRLHELVDPNGLPTELLYSVAFSASEAADRLLHAPAPSIGAGDVLGDFFVVGPRRGYGENGKDPDVQFPLRLGPGEELFWSALSRVKWERGYYVHADALEAAIEYRAEETGSSEHPFVVCLGQEAGEKAAQCDVECGETLFHPAHSHRFAEDEKWTEQFLDALHEWRLDEPRGDS